MGQRRWDEKGGGSCIGNIGEGSGYGKGGVVMVWGGKGRERLWICVGGRGETVDVCGRGYREM